MWETHEHTHLVDDVSQISTMGEYALSRGVSAELG